MTSYYIGNCNLSDNSKSSFYIGNHNLSDNSKSSFYIGNEDEEEEEEEEDENNFVNASLFNNAVFNIEILRNESLSPSAQTFIYLNRNAISKCVRKNPQNFQHLINNPIISKYLH